MYKVSGKPDSIGQYLTIDLTRDILGVSSTGYVIRTSCSDGQPASSRPCALKRIQTTDDRPPDLARLSHENVVQLMHYWTEERDLFIVMELMDGNLAMLMGGIERAEASPFLITVAVDIMLQIAKGMLYLHEMGFSHPQLKCENVLYKLAESKTEAFGVGDMVIKLGGFGCSMRADEKSKRRDVECFGRTCLEILTGDDLSLVTDVCGAHTVSIMAELSRIPESTPAIVRDCIETCLDDSLSVNTSIVGFEEIFTVHQLHPQPGDSYKPARTTLIFFHGFHKVPEEWKRTWMTRDNKVIWPQKWLPEDLGAENIRVYSVSFDANSNVSNKYNRFEMGKNLVQRLLLSPRWKLGENFEKAIFLVGHSFGGVLIKSLVTGARSFIDERVGNQQEVRMCENFLKNLVKIVFYSVPHGAPAAVNFELYISECRMISALQRSSFLQSLREDIRFGADMNKLSADFERAVPEKMDILAFLEGKPMSKRFVLVTKNSCEGITDNVRSWEWHKVDKDNHFEVCRPDSKNHAGYKILLNHLQQYMSAPYGSTSTPSESNSYNEACKECAKIGSTDCKNYEERRPEVSVLRKRHIPNSLSKASWQPSEKRPHAAPFSRMIYSVSPLEKINQEIKDQGEDAPGDSNAKVLTKDGSMSESNRSDVSTTAYVSSSILHDQTSSDEFKRVVEAAPASLVVPQLGSESPTLVPAGAGLPAGDASAVMQAPMPTSRIQSLRPPPVPQPLSQPSPLLEGGYRSSNCSIWSSIGEGHAQLLQSEVVLSDLETIGLLGVGSVGKVYKVRHRWTGKVYALKIIQDMHELVVWQPFVREMEVLGTFKSHNLLECSGIFHRAGEISFVLEYMDGGTLADVLKHHKKIDEHYLAEVTKQVLIGLLDLRKHQIVHADIKPSNILLNRKHEVKIADFGLSIMFGSALAQSESMTCAYMSPERFDPVGNGGAYIYAADIWSLGLTLLECAIGRYPYLKPGEKPDWPTLVYAIRWKEPPSPPAEASPEFQDFITLCLQKDSMRRPSAETLLTHPFVRRHEGHPGVISELVQDLVLDLREISGEDQISREQVSARQDNDENGPKRCRVALRKNCKYVVECRPSRFKWKLWMGTYTTIEEARRASDCVNFYTGQDKGRFYFKDSPSLFAELGPLNRPFALISKDVKDKAFNLELKKRAKQVIRKLLDARTDKQSLSYTRQPIVKKSLPDAMLQSSKVFGDRTSTGSDSLWSLGEVNLAGSLQQEVANTAPEAGDPLKNTDSSTNFDPSSDTSSLTLNVFLSSSVIISQLRHEVFRASRPPGVQPELLRFF